MIARMQSFWVALLACGAALWLLATAPHSVGFAVGGLAAAALCHPAFMALEFALMRRVNRHDPAAPATRAQLVRAWWAEVRVSVRVFCWDQPFRSQAEPDWMASVPTGKRGVVLVHGFLCNRGVWRPWLGRLRAAGHAFEAVNLEPVFGSIDDYAPLIEAAVQRVQAATGMAPVLLCHSMGGLAARAWLRSYGAQAGAHHVVTFGTPHRGTWMARFSRSGNGRQMAPGGEWLRELESSEPPDQALRFTCWYSSCDNIVFPASTATLAGADNRFIAGVSHVQMARHPLVMDACMELLAVSERPSKKADNFK